MTRILAGGFFARGGFKPAGLRVRILSNWDQDKADSPPSGAIRGGAAIAAADGSRQLLRLAVTIVLARMLLPDEFGIVAMMMAIFALASVFQDLGIGAITVQRSSISSQALGTLFWINTAVSGGLTVAFATLAPQIAAFLAHPEIEPLCRVASLTFLLNGLAAQHRALLQRRMLFAARAQVDIVAAVLGGGGALAAALLGWGPWALVSQMLVTDTVALLLVLRAIRFVPAAPVLTPEVRELLRAGSAMLGFNLVVCLSQNLYVALLGRGTGAAAAGVYTRALTLANIPHALLYAAAAHVALPKLSRMKDADAEYAQFYYKSLQLLLLVTAPLAIAFLVFAQDIARVVYGAQWEGVADLLQIFAPGLLVAPLLHSTGQVFVSRGEPHRLLRWGLFGSIVICAGTLLGLRWGVVGAAWGWSGTTLVLLLPCLAYAFRGSSITIVGVARATARVYAAAACMIPVGILVQQSLSGLGPFTRLPLALAICLSAYAVLCYFALGQKDLMQAVIGGVFGRPAGRRV